MTRHVFSQPPPLLAPLLVLGVLAMGSAVRAQDEPVTRVRDGAASEAAAATEDVEKSGPPVVGEAFPTHLPLTPLPPEGAAPEKPTPESAEDGAGPDTASKKTDGSSGGDGEAAESGPVAEDPGFALASLVGEEPRPLVLVFWSTQCVVCRRYADSIAALVTKLGDRASVAVVVSGGEESVETARGAFDELGTAVHVLLDTEMLAAGELGVRVTPTAFVVGADNVLRYRGPVDDDRRARPRDARALLLPASEAVIAGREVESGDIPPFGSAVR